MRLHTILLIATLFVAASVCYGGETEKSSAFSTLAAEVSETDSQNDKVKRRQSAVNTKASQSQTQTQQTRPQSDEEEAEEDEENQGYNRAASRNNRKSTQSVAQTAPASNRKTKPADLPTKASSKSTQSTETESENDSRPTSNRFASGNSRSQTKSAKSSNRDDYEEPQYDNAPACAIREQPGWIIDVQKSFKNGARAVSKKNATYDDCVTQCCASKRCNSVVIGVGKTHGGSSNRDKLSTCYMFDCGNFGEGRCVMSAHPDYTTVQLATAFRDLGEKCDTSPKSTTYCRDLQAICSSDQLCECDTGYVKQYAKCVKHRCRDDEFQCWSPPNGTQTDPPVCIASYNRCDARHIQQCPDGSDEFDCPTQSVAVTESRNDAEDKDKDTSSHGKLPSKPQSQPKARDRARNNDYEQTASTDAETESNTGSGRSNQAGKQRATIKPSSSSQSKPKDTEISVGSKTRQPAVSSTRDRDREPIGDEVSVANEIEDDARAQKTVKSKSGSQSIRKTASEPTNSDDGDSDVVTNAVASKPRKDKDNLRETAAPPKNTSRSRVAKVNWIVSEKEKENQDEDENEDEVSRGKAAPKQPKKPRVSATLDSEADADAEAGNQDFRAVTTRPRPYVKPKTTTASSIAENGDAESETETEDGEEPKNGDPYRKLARVLDNLRDKQRGRVVATSRKPAVQFTSRPRFASDVDADADEDADMDAEDTARQVKWGQGPGLGGRHATTRKPLYPDANWFDVPMAGEDEEETADADVDADAESGCITDYEAFTEAGAGRYNRRNRTLCRPSYGKAKSKGYFPSDLSQTKSRDRDRDRLSVQPSSSKSTLRDREKEKEKPVVSKLPSRSQQYDETYYDNLDRADDRDVDDADAEVEYEYDDPRDYDDVMGGDRSRFDFGRPSRYRYSKNLMRGYGDDERDYDTLDRNRLRDRDRDRDRDSVSSATSIISRLLSKTTTEAPSHQKVTTKTSASKQEPDSQNSPQQAVDSTFGANVTSMWNVHAILSGLFEHRGTQLDDSSVSEQNALIVAIVLLVGGLVMTSVLIALVACNLRRLLGLSKRRYSRRSVNGDTERLVNGLNL